MLLSTGAWSNMIHHEAELELSRCLFATNTAERVFANAVPTIILAASSLSFYLHLCRTPSFSWSIVLGDAMRDGFWSSRWSHYVVFGNVLVRPIFYERCSNDDQIIAQHTACNQFVP